MKIVNTLIKIAAIVSIAGSVSCAVQSIAQAQTFPVPNLKVLGTSQFFGTITATGLIGLSNLSSQPGNTVVANVTSVGASPTAYPMPICNGPGNALIWTNGIGFACNNAITATAFSGILPQANGGTGTNTATGTGSVVLNNSPTLITPALGTPSAITLTNGVGLPISGLIGLGTGVSLALGQNVTGSGSIVLNNNPTLIAPSLGTPTAINLTNGTNLPITGISGLGTGVAGGLASAVTGTGGPVLNNGPVIINPTISTAFTAPGLVTTTDLAVQAANTVLANVTASTASPTAFVIPSCSSTSSALNYTSGTGFGCNNGIATSGANSNITSLSGLTTPLSVLQGGTGTTTSTGTGSVVLNNAPSLASLTVTSAFNATGLVTNADLAAQASNTLLGNATNGSASPTAVPVPNCSATGNALQWTANVGFSCTTISGGGGGGGSGAGPNLFTNPQWQIMSPMAFTRNQVGPQSLNQLSSFSITATSTGSALTTFTVSGGPTLFPNDLVQLSGAGILAGFQQTPVRVLTTTGSPVTSFTAYSPLSETIPTSSMTGTGQVISIGDSNGTTVTTTGQNWTKTNTLKFWPTEYNTDIDPGSIRCLSFYKNGVSNEQNTYQTVSRNLLKALAGQTVTVSFRVDQRVKGGGGTSSAILIVNGTENYGTAVAGSGAYEDARLTYTLPTNLTSLSAGIAFQGAGGDQYYICKPYLGVANASLPANYFTEVPNDYLTVQQTIQPTTLNGDTITFPTAKDSSTIFYSLIHDPYAETGGRVHWSVTCEKYSFEYLASPAGVSVGWRNIIGDSVGDNMVFGPQLYNTVSGAMNSTYYNLPTDPGGSTNSVAPGFMVMHTTTSGLTINNASMNLQGFCLN